MSDYQTPFIVRNPSPLPGTPPPKEQSPTFYMIPPPPLAEPIPSCLDKQCVENNLRRLSSTKSFYSIAETTPIQPTSPLYGFILPPATASPISSELSSTQYSQVPSPVGSPRPLSQGLGLSFIPPPPQLRPISYTTQEYNPPVIPKIGEGNGLHGGPQIPAPAPLRTPTTYPDSNPHNNGVEMPKQPRVATSVGLGVEPIAVKYRNLPLGFGSGLYGGEQPPPPGPLHHKTYPHTNPHGPQIAGEEEVSMPSPSDSKIDQHMREGSGLYRGEYISASEPHHETYPQRSTHGRVGAFHEDIDDDVDMPALPRMSTHPPAPMGDEQKCTPTYLAISVSSGLHEGEQIPAPAPLTLHGPTYRRNPHGNTEAPLRMPQQPRVSSPLPLPHEHDNVVHIAGNVTVIGPPHSVCYPHANPHRNGGNTNADAPAPALAHTLSIPAPSELGHSLVTGPETYLPTGKESGEHDECQVPAPAPLYTPPVAEMSAAVPVAAPKPLHITKPTPSATTLTDAALDVQPPRRCLSKLQPGFHPQAPIPSPENRLSAAHSQLAHLVSGQGPPIDNQLPMVAPSLHIETVDFPEAVGKKPSFWQRRKKALILFLVVALIAVAIGVIFVAHSFYERWGGQGFLKKREVDGVVKLDGVIGMEAPVVYDTDFYGGKRIRVERADPPKGGVDRHCGGRWKSGKRSSQGSKNGKTNADAYLHVSDGDVLAQQPDGEGRNEQHGLLEGMIYAGYKRGWGIEPHAPSAVEGSQRINTGELNHISNVAFPDLDSSWFGLGPSWWSSRFESMAQAAKRAVPLEAAELLTTINGLMGHVRKPQASAVASEKANMPCPAHPPEGMVQWEVAVEFASCYCNRVPVETLPGGRPRVWASTHEMDIDTDVLPQDSAKGKCHEYVQRVPLDVKEDDSSSAIGIVTSWASTDMCDEEGLAPQEVAVKKCQEYTQRMPMEVKDDDFSSASGDPSSWSSSEMGTEDGLAPQEVALWKCQEYIDRVPIEIADDDSSSAVGVAEESEEAAKPPARILGGPYQSHEVVISDSQPKEAAMLAAQGYINSTPKDVRGMSESRDGETHGDESGGGIVPLLQVHLLYHPEAENEVHEHAKRKASEYVTSAPHAVAPENGNLAWKRMAARDEDRLMQKRSVDEQHPTTAAVKRAVEREHPYAARSAADEPPRGGRIKSMIRDVVREELAPRLSDQHLAALEAVRHSAEATQRTSFGGSDFGVDHTEMKAKRREPDDNGEIPVVERGDGEAEKRKNPPFTTCGDQRHGCEAFGHPVGFPPENDVNALRKRVEYLRADARPVATQVVGYAHIPPPHRSYLSSHVYPTRKPGPREWREEGRREAL